MSYYHARWYDPVVGMFVSVDPQEGNAQGVDPYAYVKGNPETWTDPTGELITDGNGNTAWVGTDSTTGSKAIYITDSRGSYTEIIPGSTFGKAQKVTVLSSGKKLNQNDCDMACQYDKSLIKNHIREEKKRWQAFLALSGDMAKMMSDLLAMLSDTELVAAEIADIISFGVHFGAFVFEMMRYLGANIPDWVFGVIDVFKGIVGAVNALRGLFSFLLPGQLLQHLFKNVMNKGRDIAVRWGMGIIATLGVGVFAGNAALGFIYYNNLVNQVDSYTPDQARQTCIQDYGQDSCF